jgi:hypothetical protein
VSVVRSRPFQISNQRVETYEGSETTTRAIVAGNILGNTDCYSWPQP